MDGIKDFLATPIVKDKDGKTVVSFGTLAVMGLGAGILYYCIPERKRRNLF